VAHGLPVVVLGFPREGVDGAKDSRGVLPHFFRQFVDSVVGARDFSCQRVEYSVDLGSSRFSTPSIFLSRRPLLVEVAHLLVEVAHLLVEAVHLLIEAIEVIVDSADIRLVAGLFASASMTYLITSYRGERAGGPTPSEHRAINHAIIEVLI